MGWLGNWLGNWLGGWLGRTGAAAAEPGICAVEAIRYLLAHDAGLLAQVPAANIMAGTLPLNTILPAICLQEISVVQRLTVAMTGARTLATSRIQATVIASSLPQQKAILDLVRRACPNQRGTIGTVEVDSIMPDIDGPDMQDAAASIFAQTKDFIVRFSLAN